MKNKTDGMNRGFSTEEAEAGFLDAGVPTTRRAYKREQMRDAHLLGNEALQEFENPDGSLKGTDPGGFLPRNNYGDRY